MNEHDLLDDWAALKPAPKPPLPEPSPGIIEPGFLWMGLFNGSIEVTGPFFPRQRVAIPASTSMLFAASFTPTPSRAWRVTHVALFLCAVDGDVVWHQSMDTIHSLALETLNISLRIDDTVGDHGKWAGFRKVLKMYGVL